MPNVHDFSKHAQIKSGTPVVLVTKVGGGTFDVRWYPDVWSAERNHVVLIASSRGVSIHTRYLHEVPEEWLDAANKVYEELKANPRADVSGYATHKHSVTSNGPLVPAGRDG